MRKKDNMQKGVEVAFATFASDNFVKIGFHVIRILFDEKNEN